MFLWTGFLKVIVVTRNYGFASGGRWLSSGGDKKKRKKAHTQEEKYRERTNEGENGGVRKGVCIVSDPSSHAGSSHQCYDHQHEEQRNVVVYVRGNSR